MYINFKLMYEKGILMSELVVLLAINQKEAYLLQSIPFEYLEEQEFVTYVKGTGPKEERVRLSPNGKALLDALTTKGMSEELLNTVHELIEIYEHYGKETGNTLEIRDRFNWFVNATGFSLPVIKNMVEEYLSNKSDFIMKLDNLIWKPQSSAFSVHYNLSDSKLFDMIMKKYKLPINFFLKPTEKRKAKDIWLFDIMKLKVPNRLPEEYYWTGSEKTDKEALNRLKKLLFKDE